jgi:hypothetical protein
MRNAYKILDGEPKWKQQLRYPGIDVRIKLKCILKKCGVDCIQLTNERAQ